MKSKKIFRLELFLTGTLFFNHYIVFHGLMPSPLYWIITFFEDHSPISIFMIVLISGMLFQSIYSYKRKNISPIIRGGITLTLGLIYILVSTLNQYIDNPQYLDINILTSIPFVIVAVLICLYMRDSKQK